MDNLGDQLTDAIEKNDLNALGTGIQLTSMKILEQIGTLGAENPGGVGESTADMYVRMLEIITKHYEERAKIEVIGGTGGQPSGQEGTGVGAQKDGSAPKAYVPPPSSRR